MQKEVEMYKDLADIQGKYIPKLVCYGYYRGGMSFVISLTIIGSMLSDQKITEQQKTRVLYLIDFGMASREDTKKKRKLFEEEQLKLSQLLDGYIVYFVKKEGRTSKSRKCKVRITELEAENTKLRQIIEENTKREAENTELKSNIWADLSHITNK
ncbi:unnamed protein product [Rhizophagus irregularis]|nr:unnamed protein product [Rhizophagus irregularis]